MNKCAEKRGREKKIARKQKKKRKTGTKRGKTQTVPLSLTNFGANLYTNRILTVFIFLQLKITLSKQNVALENWFRSCFDIEIITFDIC